MITRWIINTLLFRLQKGYFYIHKTDLPTYESTIHLFVENTRNDVTRLSNQGSMFTDSRIDYLGKTLFTLAHTQSSKDQGCVFAATTFPYWKMMNSSGVLEKGTPRRRGEYAKCLMFEQWKCEFLSPCVRTCSEQSCLAINLLSGSSFCGN